MSILQKLIAGVPELAQVKTQAQIAEAKGDPPLTFSQYKNILFAAASAFDATRDIQRPHQQRIANTGEIDITDELTSYLDADYTDSSHNIDTDLDMFEINQANTKYRPSLDKETWYKLNDLDKKTWDNISSDGKQVIIDYGVARAQ